MSNVNVLSESSQVQYSFNGMKVIVITAFNDGEKNLAIV